MQDEPARSPLPADEGFRRRYQPRLYLRLILIGLVAAYAIASCSRTTGRCTSTSCSAPRGISQIWLILLSVGLASCSAS